MSIFRTPPQVLAPTACEYVFQIAPIPFFYRRVAGREEFDRRIAEYSRRELTERQRRMGEELPGRLDAVREKQTSGLHPDYLIGSPDQWVEPRPNLPIGSHFWTPPNDILSRDIFEVSELRTMILESMKYTMQSIGYEDLADPEITESWIQFYPPHEGRGHNLHCHCRYRAEEETGVMWSGAYYLDDGDPVSDHLYSGKILFNVRGFSYVIRPYPGLLMMWPSDLLHEVKPFYGKRDRIVINFNLTARQYVA